MLLTECPVKVGRTIVLQEPYTVREMVMTKAKLDWLWAEMSKYRTLFNDFTRGSIENFVAMTVDKNSLWFEVLEDEAVIGMIYFTDIHRVIDCEAHIVFFDLKLLEKAPLCRTVAQWMFNNFPLVRISAVIPEIYRFTITLARRIGFRKEGVRRNTQLMGNKLVNEIILGMLREEAF